jgi:hypothetical protein
MGVAGYGGSGQISAVKLNMPRVTHASGPDTQLAGAARGIRTPDPVITNDVLYQLSYCGEPEKRGHEPELASRT